jgi:hypothetical protein
MKRLIAIFLSVSFVFVFFACRNVDSSSNIKELTVSIGDSVSNAKKASKHNITVDALESGRTDFEVYAASGKAYPVKLSEKNVQDILGGSTAIVQTLDGGMKVKIGSKRPAPATQKSGW